MRDKPSPVRPEYTPAGPDAESMVPPDNPPPPAPDEQDGDDFFTGPALDG